MIILKDGQTTFSDIEIIQQILAGDIGVFEILIRRYNPFLYKIGRSYSFNHQDTEDLMQESYINAFKNLEKFENRASFKTWFTRIMLNECYQKKRKFNRNKEIALDDIEFSKSNSMLNSSNNNKNKILNEELGHVIEHAIHDIPENYRMVFTLRELNGLTTLETADALNITESNVKVRLNRAKIMLQSKISETYSPEEIFEFNCIYCDAMVKKVMDDIREIMKNK